MQVRQWEGFILLEQVVWDTQVGVGWWCKVDAGMNAEAWAAQKAVLIPPPLLLKLLQIGFLAHHAAKTAFSVPILTTKPSLWPLVS